VKQQTSIDRHRSLNVIEATIGLLVIAAIVISVLFANPGPLSAQVTLEPGRSLFVGQNDRNAAAFAQDPDSTLRITALDPAPGAMLTTAPDAIVATFNRNVLPASVNGTTFRLTRSSGDGVFGNGDDVSIAANFITVTNPSEARFDLTDVTLPDDVYRVTLVGGTGAVNEREAALLALQLSGALLPPPFLYEQIRSDLAAIRQAYPAMTSIHPRPPWMPGEFLVGLTAEAWEQFISGEYHGLDDLNAQYGPVEMIPGVLNWLKLQFEQQYNPEYLAPLYAAADGVEYAEPNYIIGDGNNIQVALPYYTFRMGWGDCMAGCIHRHYWVYYVDGGSATLVNEYGDPLYRPLLPAIIADLDGHALDGEFSGTFPSGDDIVGGDFVATFVLRATSGPALFLYPDPATTMVNRTFTVDIMADTGAGTADTVDAYIDFDPDYLEVVDASGMPASSIEPNTEMFDFVTFNTTDNTAGQINFSATKLDGSLTGIFTAASIRFRAKAPTESTEAIFAHSGARMSDLYQSGKPLNATLENGAVRVDPEPALSGQVALERRGNQGDDRWITQLYRESEGAIVGNVKAYEAGTINFLGSFAATTDANGSFSVELTGIEAETYDICVKGADTLSNKKTAVSRMPGTAIHFATLFVGDSNGDDRVNGADVSYMVPSFVLCSWDEGFRPYGDTNKDGCINGADVSAMVPNFLKVGACAMVGGASITGAPSQQILLANGASTSTGPNATLALSPSSASVQAGDIFTLDIVADTGGGDADTVDAYIDFDPAHLEVVGESGAPATSIEANSDLFDFVTLNAANNTTGQINFSATKFNGSLTGSFTAATIRFRAKVKVDVTDVVFAQSGVLSPVLSPVEEPALSPPLVLSPVEGKELSKGSARISDLYRSGESLNATLGSSSDIMCWATRLGERCLE